MRFRVAPGAVYVVFGAVKRAAGPTMGIDKGGWRLFAMLKRLGMVDFDRTAMLGRQQLFVTPRELAPSVVPSGFHWKSGDYAEPFFEAFGANSVVSYDNSDFEGATFIHDFNDPLPDEHKGRYSLLFDGGSIEHIFNVKQVIQNHNALLQTGGSIVVHTRCNGDPAHGFFQLSPEFFYSALSSRNGFAKTRVFLVEPKTGRFHLILPPAFVGARNSIPKRSYDILCISTKVAECNEATAYQSDYETAWTHSKGDKFKPMRKWWHFIHSKPYRRLLRQSFHVVPERASADQINSIP